MLDILIKNANLFAHNKKMDLGIKEGEIIYKEPGNNTNKVKSKKEIEAGDKMVIPGFIDSHTHLAKVFTRDKINNKSGTLSEAINKFNSYFINEIEEKLYHRMLKIIRKAVINGTIFIRTHIEVNPQVGFKGLKTALKLKEELKDIVTIQIIAFPGSSLKISDETMEYLRKALDMGAELIGGCPHLSDDYQDTIDKIFNIALEYDVDIDLHVDESDKADVSSLEYLSEKTKRENYFGRVTAGHCTALSAVEDDVAKRVMEKVKEAEINVITLPSCNMFLMGRGDNHPIRRGVTRVKEFINMGVNISYASDNIRDPFRPFGNGDMLEEALFTAQVIQYGSEEELREVIKMGTYNPAITIGLDNYGLNLGNDANLVILDSIDAVSSLLNGSEKTYVIKDGTIVATNNRMSKILI